MLTLENFGFFCQEFGLWDPAVEAAPSFLDFDQEVCCIEGPVPDRVYQGGSTHSVRWVLEVCEDEWIELAGEQHLLTANLQDLALIQHVRFVQYIKYKL